MTTALLLASGAVAGYASAWLHVWVLVRSTDRAPRKHRMEATS